MKARVERLVAVYSREIDDSEKLIKEVEARQRQARSQGQSVQQINCALGLARHLARKQALVQAKADLEGLLG